MYPDLRSAAFVRRGMFAMIVFNAALLVAAIIFVPTFGVNGLESGVAGDQPTGVRPVQTNTVNLPATSALTSIAKGVDAAKVLKGWRGGRDGSSLEVTPVEVSCFAKGAPAPVEVRTKGWTRGGVNASGLASESVMWSVRAYAAGQGSAWFTNLRDNANRCGVGVYTIAGLGTDAVSFVSGRVSTLVWRHGDVISTIGYQRNQQPGYISVVRSAAERIDKVMKSVLDGVCADTGSTAASDRGRSPYVRASSFVGLFVSQKFEVEPTVMEPPYDWADTGGKTIQKVTPVVFPTSLTEKPTGVVPISMPEPVVAPETPPKAPTKPQPTFKVNEQQDDTVGPGCGWAFTAQKTPTFDTPAAQSVFKRAVTSKRTTINLAWINWFPAMADHAIAYRAYTKEVKTYNAYIEEVLTASKAWQLIQDARDKYDTAMARYQKTVDAREAFLTEQEAAKIIYDEDRQFCSTDMFEPTDPDRAEPTCPAEKPAILSQKAPAASTRPVKPDEETIVKELQKRKEKESEQRGS